MRRIVIITLLLAFSLGGFAQSKKKVEEPVGDRTRVLLILDCSHSMWDRWQSDSKIKVTQTVLLRFLDSIAAKGDIDVALRVFGHLNKDAYGTRLECPFEADNNYKLQSKIKTLVPNGGCTAATALGNALHDFPPAAASRNIILIITDGMDDSDGGICDVARQVQLSGTIVQTFILGIGNPTDFHQNLDCAGKFTHIPSEEQYTDALYDIFRQSEETARVVINLKDDEDGLYETEVPIVLYDAQTHVAKYSLIYTLDSRYAPDTLLIDPLVDYDIDVLTRPHLSLKGQRFAPDKLNVLDVKVEQGSLRVRKEERRVVWQVPNYSLLVRQQGSAKVLNVQQLGSKADYCAGTYDIDVLSTPPIHLGGVEVRKGANTELTIPMPGMLLIDKPKVVTTGSIFSLEDGIMTWVCDLNSNSVSERILLMPGEYEVLLKPRDESSYQAVRTKRFVIEAGLQTSVSF